MNKRERLHLGEGTGVEGSKDRGKNRLVHVVEVLEGCTRGESSLHEVKHRHHAYMEKTKREEKGLSQIQRMYK